MKKIIIVITTSLLFIGCTEKENKNETQQIKEFQKVQKSEPIKAAPKKMPTWEEYQ